MPYAIRNGEREQATKAAQHERNKKWVADYLLAHPCVDCGERDLRVLEFDHVGDDKEINITNLLRHNCSVARLEQEISKCQVRCANCHRKVTYARLGDSCWRSRYQQKVNLQARCPAPDASPSGAASYCPWRGDQRG